MVSTSSSSTLRESTKNIAMKGRHENFSIDSRQFQDPRRQKKAASLETNKQKFSLKSCFDLYVFALAGFRQWSKETRDDVGDEQDEKNDLINDSAAPFSGEREREREMESEPQNASSRFLFIFFSICAFRSSMIFIFLRAGRGGWVKHKTNVKIC